MKDIKANAKAIEKSSVNMRAYEDVYFLHRDELRSVRLQLELLKPEIYQQEAGIESTVVLYGGARIKSKEVATEHLASCKAALEKNPKQEKLQREVKLAERIMVNSKYYEEARQFAAMVSRIFKKTGVHDFIIVTGGGPGIMEAGNRGAFEEDCLSIGLNITIPNEQDPNPYITPELCFLFHYFAVRKMHFLLRAKAALFFPGGFGTLDEMFETLTLIQTGKMKPIPLVLFGKEFWERVINFDTMVEEGTVGEEDLKLFHYADDYKSAWNHIARFYELDEVK